MQGKVKNFLIASVPLLIGVFAALLSIGGLPKLIKDILKKAVNKIRCLLLKLLCTLAVPLKKLWSKLMKGEQKSRACKIPDPKSGCGCSGGGGGPAPNAAGVRGLGAGGAAGNNESSGNGNNDDPCEEECKGRTIKFADLPNAAQERIDAVYGRGPIPPDGIDETPYNNTEKVLPVSGEPYMHYGGLDPKADNRGEPRLFRGIGNGTWYWSEDHGKNCIKCIDCH